MGAEELKRVEAIKERPWDGGSPYANLEWLADRVLDLHARTEALVAAAEEAIHIMQRGWIPPDSLTTPGEIRAWDDACEAFRDSGIFSRLQEALKPFREERDVLR